MVEKPSVLTITRADGTSTWSKLHKGLETHDLAHFAVEKCLGFTKAFYGLINQGNRITDFELPRDQRPTAVTPENLDVEALVTEHIVNLLEIEHLNSGFNANFLTDLKIILDQNNLPFPNELNNDTLQSIKTMYQALVQQWLALTPDETLELNF